MLRDKTLCMTLGLCSILGFWGPRAAWAHEGGPPAPGPVPIDVVDDGPDDPGEGPGLPPPPAPPPPLPPPPMMGGPSPEVPRPFEGPRPSERRLFGRQHPRVLYETLPEEEKFRVEDFMRRHFPDLFEELTRLDQDEPPLFSRTVNRVLPQVLRLMRLEQEDPETFPLEVDEVRLSMHIRAWARRITPPGGRERNEKPVAELRELLERRFDVRQQIHRIEMHRLERRLADARERLERRTADKEEIIAQELQEILAPRPPARKPPHDRPGRPDENRPPRAPETPE